MALTMNRIFKILKQSLYKTQQVDVTAIWQQQLPPPGWFSLDGKCLFLCQGKLGLLEAEGSTQHGLLRERTVLPWRSAVSGNQICLLPPPARSIEIKLFYILLLIEFSQLC